MTAEAAPKDRLEEGGRAGMCLLWLLRWHQGQDKRLGLKEGTLSSHETARPTVPQAPAGITPEHCWVQQRIKLLAFLFVLGHINDAQTLLRNFS